MRTVSEFIKALWLYIAGIIAVVLIYFLLTGIDQGIDVVMQMGEYPGPAIYGVVSVLLWAYLVWYSSRFISYTKQAKEDEIGGKGIKIPVYYHQHIPRLLAVNCFASIQYAILCLPTFPFKEHSGWLLIALLVIHNGAYFGLTYWFNGKFKNIYTYGLSWVLFIVNAGVLVCLLISNWQYHSWHSVHKHKFYLPVIGLFLLCFEIIMIYSFILRRKSIDARKKANSGKAPFFIKKSNSKMNYFASEGNFFRWFAGISLVALLLYFIAIFSMTMSNNFGPLAFSLLALGILVGLSNLITYKNIHSSVNFSLILFIVAVIVGKYFRNPYEVKFIPAAKSPLHSKRPTVKKYFHNWVYSRYDTLKKYHANHTHFDVYLVLSNGGASRAGDWAGKVLCKLQDTSQRRFGYHILCIAGASGGTVGNCAFYSLLRAEQQKKLNADTCQAHSSLFFSSDFLTYTLGRMLGLDIFRHFIPVTCFSDRGAALADVMSGYAHDSLLQSYFNNDVDSIFDSTGMLPFFFMNTTHVEDGRPGVISVTRLPANSQRIDIFDSIDKYDSGKSLKLSTAAVLSSRFPYVSPAGKIGNDYFVDGGYFDNSGSGIMLEFMEEINCLIASKKDTIYQYCDSLRFHLLHIYNSEVFEKAPEDIKPLENDFLTPVLTLIGIQNASTKIGDGILMNFLNSSQNCSKDSIIEFSLYNRFLRKNNPDTIEDGFPMSWVTSDYQLWRMRKSLKREDSANYLFLKNIIK